MKKLSLLFFFICMQSCTPMSFTANAERERVNYQESFWPKIKGKWWPSPDGSDNLIRMQKMAVTHGFINFFSKDSCEMETRRYDDVLIREKYKWINNMDTLKIYRKADTLVAKVIKFTNSEFNFIPM